MTDGAAGDVSGLLRGMMTTQALRVVAELEIADALANGSLPVEELASSAGVDADSLGRFLRALAAEGVFAEESPGVFRNTPASDLLRQPGAPHDFALLFGRQIYEAFGASLDVVRSGEPAFSRLYGMPWWKWLEQNPEEGRLFNRAMQGQATGRIELLAAQSWRGDETVVDVGGGNGTLLAGLLLSHEGLRGVVFDLPDVAGEARVRIAEAGLSHRCDVVAGSFFEDDVPVGDVYVLSIVLHDWDDEPAAAILRSVRSAARPGARVLILESVIDPRHPGANAWRDLLMLVLVGGRERSENDWRTLLCRASFRTVRIADGLIEAEPD
jgi:SAM-dependent methyltransferase